VRYPDFYRIGVRPTYFSQTERGVVLKFLFSIFLFGVAACVWATGVSDIELRRLFEPTTSELEQEAKGRIYVYDGLRDKDVEQAVNEEFDRVENMMFIREKKTDEKGEVLTNPDTGDAVVQDDGC
jgi:hypothetical protein